MRLTPKAKKQRNEEIARLKKNISKNEELLKKWKRPDAPATLRLTEQVLLDKETLRLMLKHPCQK